MLNGTKLKLLPNIISKAGMSTLTTFNEYWLEILARNKERKNIKIEKKPQKTKKQNQKSINIGRKVKTISISR